MATHYKIKTPNGMVRKFINTGDGHGARQAAEYWFDGCSIELMQASLAFKTEKRAELTIEELRDRAGKA